MTDLIAPERALSSKGEFAATGPGTLSGRYLRSFWQPVYHSCDLAVGRPVPLRIMGETYTLYRGESGSVYMVDARCPHRGTQLSTASVEGEALRCFYHGWKFASNGACIEQPAEESSFCSKVNLRAWPAQDYLGLVFAYLGQASAPQLPRYPEFEQFAGLVEIDSYLRECNYFQNLENALDMSHVGFAHGDNRGAFEGIGLGRRLQAEESSWGVTYTFTRADGALRVQQFGMPNIFYMNALPNDPDIGWQESLFWWVPIDDDRHIQFSLHRVPVTGEAARRVRERRQQRRSEIDLAHQDVCAQVLSGQTYLCDVDKSRVDLVRLQDDIAQVGQGVIADRSAERLGRADIGITAIRRIWRRELGLMVEDKPGKSWRRDRTVVPRVWGLDGGSAVSSSDTSVSAGATPDVMDVRPFIEVDVQRKALHGTRRA